MLSAQGYTRKGAFLVEHPSEVWDGNRPNDARRAILSRARIDPEEDDACKALLVQHATTPADRW